MGFSSARGLSAVRVKPNCTRLREVELLVDRACREVQSEKVDLSDLD